MDKNNKTSKWLQATVKEFENFNSKTVALYLTFREKEINEALKKEIISEPYTLQSIAERVQSKKDVPALVLEKFKQIVRGVYNNDLLKHQVNQDPLTNTSITDSKKNSQIKTQGLLAVTESMHEIIMAKTLQTETMFMLRKRINALLEDTETRSAIKKEKVGYYVVDDNNQVKNTLRSQIFKQMAIDLTKQLHLVQDYLEHFSESKNPTVVCISQNLARGITALHNHEESKAVIDYANGVFKQAENKQINQVSFKAK